MFARSRGDVGKRIRLVDLGRQYRSIKEEIDAALLETVASSEFVLGDAVRTFEDAYAAYTETRFCVGVASGTAAIQLALEAIGISDGDEVIVPANTFIASVLPVLRLRARPVLVDCDERTATVDPERAAAAVGPRTKAVLAVHLYGHPADLDPLLDLCAAHGLVLVEDACQAHGARYKGRRLGSIGRVAAFSFYPGKNLGAYGDAGAVTTDDEELAERVRLLRNLGQASKYVHVVEGWNERLDALQAAVLRIKLAHLDRWNERRRRHAAAYAEALAGAPLRLPRAEPWADPVWHLYVVRSPRREAVRASLAASGVETGLHYPVPLHLQPALKSLGYAPGDFPAAERWAEELLSLPMFPELEQEEIELVGELVAAAGTS
jgi:dTDP-4-amino-4,6-dideoxygalactose transaminase